MNIAISLVSISLNVLQHNQLILSLILFFLALKSSIIFKMETFGSDCQEWKKVSVPGSENLPGFITEHGS
jgi:hypothetical protein